MAVMVDGLLGRTMMGRTMSGGVEPASRGKPVCKSADGAWFHALHRANAKLIAKIPEI